MPDAILVQFASEIVDSLNGAATGTFNQTFEAERSYADWELPLDETAPIGKVLVDVVPVAPLGVESETRSTVAYTPEVDIIVRKRLGPDDRDANGKLTLAVVDELVLFVEQLSEFFTFDQLPTSSMRWQATEIRRPYVAKHLHELNQFTGIVRLTFDMSEVIT